MENMFKKGSQNSNENWQTHNHWLTQCNGMN